MITQREFINCNVSERTAGLSKNRAIQVACNKIVPLELFLQIQ
jgi:hypothetical protein